MPSICILLQSHYEIDIRVRRKAEALVAAGYDVDVLALRLSNSNPAHYTLNGVNLYTVSIGRKRGSLARYFFEYFAFFFWALYKFERLAARKQYALVDTNNLPDFLVFAGIWGKRKGAKVLLDMHEITPEFFISKYKMNPNSWSVRLLKFIERISLQFADYVINVNEPIENVLVSRGLDRSKSTIIMNCVDEQFFTTSAASGSSNIQMPSNPKLLMMYHGTITGIYGLDIAIEAFGRVHEKMPGAEFWILGKVGDEMRGLLDQVRNLGLESKVRFIGSVPAHEIPHWVNRCDIGVLATRQDVFLDLSFSGKLSEYIICGKAVIASRLKTIRYYFSEQALAYFRPHDSAELGEQMVRLYQDPVRRSQLAEAARREYAPIRWVVMRQRYLKLISEITGHPFDGITPKAVESYPAREAGISR